MENQKNSHRGNPAGPQGRHEIRVPLRLLLPLLKLFSMHELLRTVREALRARECRPTDDAFPTMRIGTVPGLQIQGKQPGHNTNMGITNTGNVLTVTGFAELTSANSKLFRTKVCAAMNGHTVIEIDLSQTRSMDCAGFGALIAVRNLARSRNGVVRLLDPIPSVQQFLDLVRAGLVFETVTTQPPNHPSERATALSEPGSSFLAPHDQATPVSQLASTKGTCGEAALHLKSSGVEVLQPTVGDPSDNGIAVDPRFTTVVKTSAIELAKPALSPGLAL